MPLFKHRPPQVCHHASSLAGIEKFVQSCEKLTCLFALPFDLLDNRHHLRRLTGPSIIEMRLHSTHIGNRCTQPVHKSQTTPHSIVSTLTFGKSPLGVPFRRGVSLAFQNCTRRLVQSGAVSATGATMETMDAKTRIQQLDITDTMHWEEDQELVHLAIVWALQHGLVSCLFLQHRLS